MSERVREEEEDLNRLESGKVLDGRYEVIKFIGAGAFAAVYKARQLNIQRMVAVKVLNIINAWQDSATRKAFGDRFVREAQTAAQIRHPNVVTIFDFGIIADVGQPYIVMELLEGHDLEEELQTIGPMEPARAIDLMMQSLEALGEGHERGIVHKDLKPANLFLTSPGTRKEKLKIVDFGIARIQEEEGQKLTGTGQLFGTPQYLAPEYIERQIATPALDVYQMGLILVEMLTAKTVVDVDNPYKCLMMHCSGDLPIPAFITDSPLGPILAKALHVEHEERFPNADAFADALASVDASAIGAAGADVDSSEIAMASTMAGGVDPLGGTDVLAQPRATPTPDKPLPQPSDLGASPVSPSVASAPAPAAQDSVDDAPVVGRGGPPLGLIGLVALLVVLLAGGIGFLVMSSDEEPDAAVAAETSRGDEAQADEAPAEDDAPEPDEAALAADEVDEVDEPPTEKEEAPAAAPVVLEIQTEPEGATVRRGDEELGVTPLKIEFDGPDAEHAELTLDKEGFETATINVAPGDGDVAFSMKPSPKQALSDRRKAARDRLADKRRKQRKKEEAPTDEAAPPEKKKKTGGMGFVDDKKKSGGKDKSKGIGFIE